MNCRTASHQNRIRARPNLHAMCVCDAISHCNFFSTSTLLLHVSLSIVINDHATEPKIIIKIKYYIDGLIGNDIDSGRK